MPTRSPTFRSAALIAAAFALVACGEDIPTSAPKPIELSRADVGHYCRMIVVDHKGPKGQIHIKGRDKPVFFSSVRDTIAFTMLPEEPKRLTAIYVNDMGRSNWDKPQKGTWIDARKAHYVIGSSRRGGMGAPEAVPFSQPGTATAFAARYGGRVVGFDKIPKGYILGHSGAAPSYGGRPAGGHQHGDAKSDQKPMSGHAGHGGSMNKEPPMTGKTGHGSKSDEHKKAPAGHHGEQGRH